MARLVCRIVLLLTELSNADRKRPASALRLFIMVSMSLSLTRWAGANEAPRTINIDATTMKRFMDWNLLIRSPRNPRNFMLASVGNSRQFKVRSWVGLKFLPVTTKRHVELAKHLAGSAFAAGRQLYGFARNPSGLKSLRITPGLGSLLKIERLTRLVRLDPIRHPP